MRTWKCLAARAAAALLLGAALAASMVALDPPPEEQAPARLSTPMDTIGHQGGAAS